MTNQYETQPERIAPHSGESEEAVLGSILINPEALFDVMNFLQTDDFFLQRHMWVWDAILAIHNRGEFIDNLTVIEELRNRKQLDIIGGSSYITHLMNCVPTHIHAETYGRLVERAAIRRRLLVAAQDIAKAAIDEDAEINEVIERSNHSLSSVTARRDGRSLKSVSRLVQSHMDKVENRYHHKGEPIGLPTGFTDLDNVLFGLRRQRLHLVAARPGVGKTAWMLNVARNAAQHPSLGSLGGGIAIFSLEMSEDELMDRLISSETDINSVKFNSGDMDDREFSLYHEAVSKIDRWPLFIDDTPAVNITQLSAKCRRLQREHGLSLIIVDYLQLMLTEKKSENRTQEVSQISRGLKILARELNVPVLAAAQLNRNLEQRSDKRPMLSDLRDSGSLEQDADVVMFIHRDDMLNENSERPNQADIIVAKHRGGATGTVTLYFQKELTKFTNISRNKHSVRS